MKLNFCFKKKSDIELAIQILSDNNKKSIDLLNLSNKIPQGGQDVLISNIEANNALIEALKDFLENDNFNDPQRFKQISNAVLKSLDAFWKIYRILDGLGHRDMVNRKIDRITLQKVIH